MYNLALLPKKYRDPQYANDPTYFLMLEKDNPGYYDEANNRYFRANDNPETMNNWSRVRKPVELVVTDEKNNKFRIRKYEVWENWSDVGISSVRYLGKSKLAKKK